MSKPMIYTCSQCAGSGDNYITGERCRNCDGKGEYTVGAELYHDDEEEIGPHETFPYNLHSGDEVTWTDPDGGDSQVLKIVAIEWHDYSMAKITHEDGYIEVLENELS
ncbi:MAG: hypothetical protein OEY01_03550 [Desulfobulbaceae bacterium]|nr:hypothetical protein [Desulfobulbaceae bacterium]